MTNLELIVERADRLARLAQQAADAAGRCQQIIEENRIRSAERLAALRESGDALDREFARVMAAIAPPIAPESQP